MSTYNTRIVYPAIIATIVYLTYCTGISGQFQFDDYPNIVLNERLHIKTLDLENVTKAALSSTSGILKRPISMASLAINYYFSGLNPFSYKLTNLVIHIINTLGIYILCLLLYGSIKSYNFNISKYNASLAVAIAWGVHPINLTAVLYVVQRMTSLATLFTLCATCLYLIARKKLDNNHTAKGITYLFLVIIFGILGVLSKENAALIFLYLFIIECCLYREKEHSSNYKKIVIIFFTLCLFTPGIVIAAYTFNNPEWILKGYSATSFTLHERLITQARILWMYIYWILLPNNGNLGFLHDDITLSTNLFDQTFPILSIIGHILSIFILVLLWRRKKQLLFVLGYSFFYASHLIESTVFALILIFEHRNYFGSFGLMLGIFSYAFSVTNKYKNISLIGVTIYIILLIFLTAQRSMIWGDGIRSALVDVHHHPNSSAAHYELGRQYSMKSEIKLTNKAAFHFKKASEIDTKRADPLFALLMLSAKNNKPVKDELIDKINHRLRTSPVYAGHITWMGALVKCYTNSTCAINKEHMITMIQSSLDNNHLDQSALSESYYLMIASGFLANSGNNYTQALAFSLQAAISSPREVKFIINIINLALSHNDYDTANQWILELDNSFSNIYPNEIINFKDRLAELSVSDK
jgi:hypothetical protein